MIKVFSGTDTFESYQAAKTEAETLAKKLGFALKILNTDEFSSVDQFLAEVESMGMFAEASVVLAKRFMQNKKLAEYLKEHFDYLNKFEIVIWEDKKLDGRLELIKKLKKSKLVNEFEILKDWQFKKWLIDQANKNSIRLNSTQIDYISQALGTDKWIASNELTKIQLFLSHWKTNTISDAELKSVLGFDVRGDMWSFLDALGYRNKTKAINEFEKLTKYESNVQLLIAMIARELNLIAKTLYAQSKNIDLKSIGIHPFVLEKTIQKAVKFKWREIKLYSKKLMQLDLAIKRGDIDEKIAMTLYLLSF